MSHSSEQHWDAVLVGCLYTFFILDASAWLDDGFYVFFSTEIHHIAEREKSIRSQNQLSAEFLFGSFHRLLCRPDSIDLPATDTQRLCSVRNYYRIGFYIFHYSLCKKQGFSLFFCRLFFGYSFYFL